VHLIVNPGQVSDGGTLTDSSEFVVHGTVTKADPALVRAQVGHWDATQMSANGGAADDGGVTSI